MQSILQYSFPQNSILRPMVFTETTNRRKSSKTFQSIYYKRVLNHNVEFMSPVFKLILILFSSESNELGRTVLNFENISRVVA